MLRGGRRALDGFTAEIPGGGVTAVFGPSGSGKSALLRLCNRLEVPLSGRARFDGDDVFPGRSLAWSWLWVVAMIAYAGDVARRRAKCRASWCSPSPGSLRRPWLR